MNINNENQKRKYIYRVGSFYPKKLQSIEEKKENENELDNVKNNSIFKEYIEEIKINILQFYCFRGLSSKRNEIILFENGFSLFKKRMDIINVFVLLLLTEKNCLQIEN